jgi:hypothetical protein
MNFTRIFLATLAAFFAYMVLGGLVFGLSPLKKEFMKYPSVYRTPETMKGVMPLGMVGMILSMFTLAVLYALMTHTGSNVADGALFGALIGGYSVGSFVLHNHVNLNIGLTLTIGQAVAYFIQWTIVGMVIALVYRPLTG